MTREPVLFQTGDIRISRRCLQVLGAINLHPLSLIVRHEVGDWGDLDDGQRAANVEALAVRNTIVSRYRPAEGIDLWVITQDDRERTWILLSDEGW